MRLLEFARDFRQALRERGRVLTGPARALERALDVAHHLEQQLARGGVDAFRAAELRVQLCEVAAQQALVHGAAV